MKIAKVYIEYGSLKVNRPFDYLVKEDQNICKGVRVYINFNHAMIVGYVVDVYEVDKTEDKLKEELGYELKYIEKVIDEKPLINEEIEDVVKYLERETLCSLIKCYQTVLPPSLKPSSSKMKASILKKKYYRVKDLDFKLNEAQKEIVDFILEKKEVCKDDLDFSSARIKTLVKKGVLEEIEKEEYRNLIKDTESTKWKKLTKDQQNALEQIQQSKKDVVLLEGVTGSGKTELYLYLIKEAIEKGQNALVLVPEIALTPLIIKRISERFNEGIAIFHSGLNTSEKYDQYRRIVNKEVRIVIGTRSAVFVPLENIGVIILDEEHSESYKQDNAPSYHAKDIAIFRAKKNNAKVILGSATPSLESKVRALTKNYTLVTLSKRINNQKLPSTEIVDMNEELKQGNYSIFSLSLLSKIEDRLNKNEQIILLLNKRGYASYVSCRKCHYVFKCPCCDVSLTYHKKDESLKCHYCGYTQDYPSICPNCGSSSIRYIGLGTQKIEEEIKKRFPDAKVARMDYDSTAKKHSLEKILEDFDNHKYDILLGTQMIAKGLDFPLVTLVGVINADIGLYLNDFRSGERTYQLLTQVIGRSGRENKKGEALIQTYTPENYVINEAKKQDYNDFFRQEVLYRKERNYPPFSIFATLLFKGRNYDETYLLADNMKKYIEQRDEDIFVFGPVAPYIAKENDLYKVKLTLKYKDSQKTLKLIKELIESINNNTKISLSVIIDPYQD